MENDVSKWLKSNDSFIYENHKFNKQNIYNFTRVEKNNIKKLI